MSFPILLMLHSVGTAADLDVTIEVPGRPPTSVTIRNITEGSLPSLIVPSHQDGPQRVDLDVQMVSSIQYAVTASLQKVAVDSAGGWVFTEVSRPRVTVVADTPGVVAVASDPPGAAASFRMEFVVRP